MAFSGINHSHRSSTSTASATFDSGSHICGCELFECFTLHAQNEKLIIQIHNSIAWTWVGMYVGGLHIYRLTQLIYTFERHTWFFAWLNSLRRQQKKKMPFFWNDKYFHCWFKHEKNIDIWIFKLKFSFIETTVSSLTPVLFAEHKIFSWKF